MGSSLLILGAGGHAKVVADCALTSDYWQDVVFLDDRYPDLKKVGPWDVIGRIAELEGFVPGFPEMALGVGVSYDALRLQWLERGERVGARFPAVVHSAASISPLAEIGEGAVVFAGSVINVDSIIGRACIVNTNCSIDHDCKIGEGSHVSPGASLAGGVSTGERVWVGMGAQVIQGVTIGSDAIIGAGSVVLDDVVSGSTVVGVPAKRIS